MKALLAGVVAAVVVAGVSWAGANVCRPPGAAPAIVKTRMITAVTQWMRHGVYVAPQEATEEVGHGFYFSAEPFGASDIEELRGKGVVAGPYESLTKARFEIAVYAATGEVPDALVEGWR